MNTGIAFEFMNHHDKFVEVAREWTIKYAHPIN
jgi:hypothetical protein